MMKAVLIPHTVFVGDTAQYLVPLSDHEVYTLKQHNAVPETALPFTSIAENKTMTIKELRITVRGTQHCLLITFIPWETGTVYFPSFSFLHIQRELPSITVASILDKNGTNSLQPPKQPLMMPGTDYLLYSAAGILLACSVTLTALLVYLYRFIKKRRIGSGAKKRRKYLKKQLKKMQKAARKIEKKLKKTPKYAEIQRTLHDWYALLDHILREYFFLLFKDYTVQTKTVQNTAREFFFSATYTELKTALTVFYTGTPELSRNFSSIYKRLEYNRFGRRICTPFDMTMTDCSYLIQEIPVLADKTEQNYAEYLRKVKTGDSHV